MIPIRSKEEIRKIAAACRIVAMVLRQASAEVKNGVTTREIDQKIRGWIRDADSVPAFLGYRGFPASACVSINEEVVHGIPGARRIKDGDIVSIDVGVTKNGYCGDGAVTVAVGTISDRERRLMESTERALAAGIEMAKKGNRISDISHAVESTVKHDGFAAVRALVGHGIGTHVHEEPQIPNFGKAGRGPVIEEGMVLAIEPMINAGTHDVYTDTDGWTVITDDHLPSAHFEHTVAIVDGKAEILTRVE